ncbi:MAG TPA: amidohydrolase family protein [Caulobacteraceae bacterium]|nr:amidohydrolase family protein [Caulobacteraceae bacterium]
MSEILEALRRDPERTRFNLWRRKTPGAAGWPRSVRPGAPDKYFMFSADTHLVEPADYLADIEPQYRERIPRLELRDDGSQWLITEGNRPQRVRGAAKAAGEAAISAGAGAVFSPLDDEDALRNAAGRTVEQRLADNAADGVDAELMFPNRGLLSWATPDPAFAMAMCRQWNRWAHRFCGPHMQGATPRMLPAALIAPGDQAGAMAEIAWAAEHGFRALTLSNSVIYGPKRFGELEYNDPSFEEMWSLIEEARLVACFHVSTGRDPRAVGGAGGAIINYACHSMETTIEPLVQMIASGVFARHPKLNAGLVESGVGFVPWLLETLDHAARAHHFWVRPQLPEPPSAYFRRNCFATFQDDAAGLKLVESYGLVDNFLWANDYPHHEGSWPHSAEAIERTMGGLADDTRAKILGLNAARLFGLDPAAYRRD